MEGRRVVARRREVVWRRNNPTPRFVMAHLFPRFERSGGGRVLYGIFASYVVCTMVHTGRSREARHFVADFSEGLANT